MPDEHEVEIRIGTSGYSFLDWIGPFYPEGIERGKMLDKLDEINQQFGVERTIICDSGWSNDEWQFFGVDKYPNIEILQEVYKQLDGIQWSRYVVTKSILGTQWSRS